MDRTYSISPHRSPTLLAPLLAHEIAECERQIEEQTQLVLHLLSTGRSSADARDLLACLRLRQWRLEHLLRRCACADG